ncbi:hypothetical protein D3C81_1770730 [compost metagenome]
MTTNSHTTGLRCRWKWVNISLSTSSNVSPAVANVAEINRSRRCDITTKVSGKMISR